MASAAGITTSFAPSGTNSLKNPLSNIATPSTASGPVNALSSARSPSSPLSAPASATSRPGVVSSLSPDLAHTPWAQALVHPTSSILPSASLPNLAALQNPISTVNGLIPLGYVAQPAPVGVADYGLAPTPYSYNTSHIDGSLTLNTPPNATNPGGINFVEPSSGGQHQGAIGSPYTWGIQLNTMGVNATIPGTYDPVTGDWAGYVWAQNVLNFNDSGIHFVQDTWNFSLDSDAYMAPNSIYSGCNNNTAGVNYIMEVYGGILQCVGPTIPISASDYPITISLYNNFTTNAQQRTQLDYGYSIYMGGVAKTYSGISDTVIFNNTNPSYLNPTAPNNAPGNTINPFSVTPTFGPDEGFWQDAEIDLVGGIGGDNAVFTAINGTVSLSYSNESSGGWQEVPSAYNFGSETGETSSGIAVTWNPNHTIDINQGPTFGEGLWNSQPQVQVPSGSVHIAGSITPSFGFVFVSNTPPVLNPWGGVEQDNMSWLPSTTGSFNTYLPAFGGTWTSTYYVQAFADGYAEANMTVTASTSALTITLTSAPGVFRAPLYMNGNAQASALAAAVGASATAPYTFSNLVIDVNFTFDHVNDYDYPSFVVLYASEVTGTLVVNNTYIGSDSAVSGNSYIGDYVRPLGGIFTPPPAVYIDIGPYTSELDIFSGAGAIVTNQELFSIDNGGSQINFWKESDASVNDTLSFESYYGVWVGDSVDTVVTNTTAFLGYGVSDYGSTGTQVTYLLAVEATGIEAFSAYDSVYTDINATEGSLGILAGYNEGTTYYYDLMGTVGLTVNNLNVTYESLGGEMSFCHDTTFNSIGVYDPAVYDSLGLELDTTTGTTVNNLVATDGSAFQIYGASGTTFNGLVIQGASDAYPNSEIDDSTGSTFVNTNLLNVEEYFDDSFYQSGGVEGAYDNGTTVTNSYSLDNFFGFVFEYSSNFTATNLNSTGSEFSYELDFGFGTNSVNGVNADDDYIGLNLYYTYPVTVTNAVIVATGFDTEYSAGIASYDTIGNSFSNVMASDDSLGVLLDYGTSNNAVSTVSADASTGVELEYAGTGNTVTGVSATDGGLGVEVDPSPGATISGTSATDESLGVLLVGTWGDTVTGTSASNESVGVFIDATDVEDEFVPSHDISVSDTTATGASVGVLVEGSGVISITGVTATNATLVDPWDSSLLGITAAVITEEVYQTSISNVVATNYPIGLYDFDSGWGTYDGEYPGSVYVNNLNSTDGYFAMVLNDTGYGYFNDIGSYQDYQGVWGNYVYENDIVGSSFVDDASYGVSLWNSEYNYIWDNSFIGDNGATSVYSAAHIQAYSGYGSNEPNFFNSPFYPYSGNYWADWSTYAYNGNLAPYYVGDDNWDEYPLNVPASETAVWFYEDGLSGGTAWSVTFNGATQTTTNDWLVFGAPNSGSFAYTAGSAAGYVASPASGTVMTGTGTTSVDIEFSAAANVTLTETGLPTGTTWSAIFGGTSGTSTTSSISISVPAGTYAFQIPQVAGYTASPSSGTVTVAGNYAISVTFTVVTYAVTVSESGLASGQSWSASINGVSQSSTGTTITFYLANGSYTVKVENVSGYSVSSSSLSVNVNGAPSGAAVSFSSTTTTSLVSTSTFNTWLAVAIAIAVIALVLGLLALFMRRGKEPQSSPQQWSPPPAGTSGGSPPASGGNWNEGPPAGGSPPS